MKKSKLQKLADNYSGVDDYCNPPTGVVLGYLKEMTRIIDTEIVDKLNQAKEEPIEQLVTLTHNEYHIISKAMEDCYAKMTRMEILDKLKKLIKP